MWFGVLGDLAARDQTGAPVRLPGAVRRTLLAALLHQAGRSISADALIDDVWGASPPRTAAKTLQSHMVRLRDDLGLAGRQLLLTDATGYRIQLNPESLDSATFEKLTEAGLDLIKRGQPSEAIAALEQGLALWRGDAYQDLIDAPFAVAERLRLSELRWIALEHRTASQLGLGESSSLVAELEQRVRDTPYRERSWEQLMLAQYRSGQQRAALASFRQIRDLLAGELGVDPSPSLRELERRILNHDNSLQLASVERLALSDDGCAYRGLEGFAENDAALFVGREALVNDIAVAIADRDMLVVAGASGSGKSSLVRAGLVPALRAGALPGSPSWRIATATPTTTLPTGPVDLVIVDQAEELFTVLDSTTRRRWVDGLIELTHRGGRAVVVLRSDFFGRLVDEPDLAAAAGSPILVPQLRADQLRRAIIEPAARLGVTVEDSVVEAILQDSSDQRQPMPLVSMALVRAWDRRTDATVTAEAYRSAGGVSGALRDAAEAAWDSMPGDVQSQARSLLVRMASRESSGWVRRPLVRTAVTQPAARAAVATFAAARILTVSNERIELAHDALLLHWPRLQQWLTEWADHSELAEHVSASAETWRDDGRQSEDLYRGARLAAAQEWRADNDDELSDLEHEFITASESVSLRAVKAQQRQNRRLRALLGGIAVLLVVSVIAGLVAVVQRHHATQDATSALARSLGSEAISQPSIDEAMLLAREGVDLHDSEATEGPLLSTLLRTPALIGSFQDPIQDRPQGLDLSPDGQYLEVSDNDGVDRFYDPATHAAALKPLKSFEGYLGNAWVGQYFVAQNSQLDPHRIAVNVYDSDNDNDLVRAMKAPHRWAFQPTTPVDPVIGMKGAPYFFLAYSLENPATGTPLATYLARWNITTGALRQRRIPGVGMVGARQTGASLTVVTNRSVDTIDPRTMDLTQTNRIHGLTTESAAAISPDGRELVYQPYAGSTDTLATFHEMNLRNGRVNPRVGQQGAAIDSLTFTPDGTRVITSGDNGESIVWNASNLAIDQTLAGNTDRTKGPTFSADGQTLWTCSLDGSILEWDIGAARRYGRPYSVASRPFVDGPGSPRQQPALAASPLGDEVVESANTSTATVLATSTARRIATLTTPSTNTADDPRARDITSVAWSSRDVVATAADGSVSLWDPRAPARPVRSLALSAGAPVSSAFSPDGALLAVITNTDTPFARRPPGNQDLPDDGWLDVFDVTSGQRLVADHLHTNGEAVDFSPDGTSLAAGLGDAVVKIIDSQNGQTLRTLTSDADVTALAYRSSQDLVVGNYDGIARQWNPQSGAPVSRPTLVEPSPVSSISIDPTTSRFAVTGGSSGLIGLWDARTMTQFGSSFPGGSSYWGNAVYTPDGKNLVSLYQDGSGYDWPVSIGALEAQACTVAGRNFTSEEWHRFVLGIGYRRTCPQYPPG